MKLDELLPSVYRSDFNRSLFENTFNRFFTKPETQPVSGYIGRSTAKYVKSRQIVEPDIHRQAFQLQPIVYAKNGTVDHMMSWKDALNKLEQQGIDISRLNEWGSIQEFNFAPPIDFDKLVNYRNYFWVDQNNSNSTPQYVTIRNRCTVAKANLNTWQKVITSYGESIVLSQIVSSNLTTDYDTFVVEGNYESLFGSAFPLYILGSTNSDINEKTFVVIESYHLLGKTYIKVEETFLNNAVSGSIDFTQRLVQLQNEYDCICESSAGWDTLLWDDNPADPIWNGDFDSLLAAITDVQNMTLGLWYETSSNTLYQLNLTNDWVVVYTNFSDILDLTNGQALWDTVSTCGIGPMTNSSDVWIKQNKWIHKADVTNFALAKQAQMPIIEFDWDLELNEWTYTKHIWKYRSDPSIAWSTVEEEPFVCELAPVDLWEYDSIDDTIVLDERYGDLTGFFKQNTKFQVYGISHTFTVTQSFYKADNAGYKFRTILYCDDTTLMQSVGGILSVGTPTSSYIFPITTSKGDAWKGYEKYSQWLYVGPSEPIPACHQPINPFTTLTVNQFVNYNVEEKYASELSPVNTFMFDTGSQPVTSISNSGRALFNYNDVRVYVNGVIQQGNYSEIVGVNTVTGIEFDSSVSFDVNDIIRVVFGAEALVDLGRERVAVRVNSNDNTFNVLDNPIVSLIRYRKVSQAKSKETQYPLFDLYTALGEPTFEAKRVFSFAIDDAYPVNQYIGERVVSDTLTNDFTFHHDLYRENNNFSYRDYKRQETKYWFDSRNGKVYTWDGLCWSDKSYTDSYCITPIVSTAQPLSPWNNIEGMLWYDLTNNKLYHRDVMLNGWIEEDVTVSEVDPTLITIWKTNVNEQYIPEKVDWNGRTFAEYEKERLTYVRARINELYVEDSSQTLVEMTATANEEWYKQQSNTLSVSGSWVGDWEIPDPLYYNNQHENRTDLTLRELITHFKSVIDSQPVVPGFSGTNASMFRLLESHQVDYSLGGTIKEFNDGFTNLLSSLFIRQPSFDQVVYFAQKQYDSLLNSLNEFFKKDFVEVFSSNIDSNDIAAVFTSFLLQQHETNSFYSLIYNDSTVQSVSNWIMTLPLLGALSSAKPLYVKDLNIGLNFIQHHDSHYDGYSFPANVASALSTQLVKTKDARTNTPLGIISSLEPPKSLSIFQTTFGFDVLTKNGALWYHTPTKTLYRMYFDFVSSVTPAVTDNYGIKWLNTTTNQVNTLTSSGWTVFNAVGELYGGPSPTTSPATSVWKKVNIDEIFAATIMEIENRLYTESKQTIKRIDLEALKATYSSLWGSLEQEYFYNFAAENGIRAPLINDEYVPSNPFTWNYIDSIPATFPSSAQTLTGCWQNVYTVLYDTPIPHLEPWRLQGYVSCPDWWMDEYSNKDKTQNDGRRWKQNAGVGMWTNILTGVIPPGRTYSNGVVSTGNTSLDQINSGAPFFNTYQYVSVNIDDSDVVVGSVTYRPDDMYPPYMSIVPSSTNRTVFDNISQISRPSSNYLYGENGTQEFAWKHNLDFFYKQIMVAYKIDPVRTFNVLFGFDLATVGDLQIDAHTLSPISQTKVTFHGDVINTNRQYKTNGINQWYVDFCRYGGFDINGSHISNMWKTWNAPLTYQMATFVETPTTEVSHKHVSLTPLDYKFLTKQAPNVEHYWMHTFDASILEFPATYLRYTSHADWKITLDTPVNRETTVKAYGVHRYQFYTDVASNTCHLNTHAINTVLESRIVISGDYREIFANSSTVSIVNSVLNDGVYTVVDVLYNDTQKVTTIHIVETLDVGDQTGLIKASSYRAIPWITGDIFDLTTDGAVPQPLYEDKQYFIIKLDDTTFRIARTQADALSNTPVILTTSGTRSSYIGQKAGSFTIKDMTNNRETWYKFAIDKNIVREISLPYTFYGLQTLVDFISGYDVYQYDLGWRINIGQVYRDDASNRSIDWQFELESFIDFAFMERIARNVTNQISYEVTYNDGLSVFEFGQYKSQHITGDSIKFTSHDGPLPNGVYDYNTYYIIRLTNSTFTIASSSVNAKNGIAISGISTAIGQGVVSISTPLNKRALIPHTYINPIRNGVWFITNKGVVSDLTSNIDNFGQHTLFAQTGMPIKTKNIFVYRQDNLTNIHTANETDNDNLAVVMIPVDYYEHVIQFNSYTVENDFVYDSFVGLNITKIEMAFDKQIGNKQRPSVGGYVITVDEQGNRHLTRNIEGNIEDLRYAYDHTLNRKNEFVEQAQKSLGYVKESTSLDSLNISPKSQFEFWKGMIQNKGSLNSIKAFVNSKRFIDAKVDDFWAIHIATYGSNLEKEYIEMMLTVADSLSSNVKFEFKASTDVSTTGFTGISLVDAQRWYNQPDQVATFANNGSEMYFTMIPNNNTYVTISGLTTVIDHNFNTNCIVCVVNMADGTTVTLNSSDFTIVNNNIITLAPATVTTYNGKVLTIWGLDVDPSSQNPFVISDIKSHTRITPVVFWNPAINVHHGIPLSHIDIQSSDDPADYTNTVINEFVDDINVIESRFVWNEKQVGTTWYDTSTVGYMPYNDPAVYPSLDDRLAIWGKQAEYSSHRVLEWVKSNVAPSDWDTAAANEVGNLAIDESVRKSGNVFKTLFRKDILSQWYVMKPSIRNYNTLTSGGTVIDISLMTDVRTDDNIELYINGTLITSFLYTATFDVATVYPTIHDYDYITCVRQIPTDADVIAALVESGDYKYEYQYTLVETLDSFNNTVSTYFFWVENKITRTNHTMSSKQISEELDVCSVPYVVFDSFLPAAGNLPIRNNRIVVCGMQGTIRDNNRYVMRFVRDYTLRDSLTAQSDIKTTVHEEWKMFRREQLSSIDRWMWDKITESMIGYKLNNVTVRVPSYERELYDTQYGTDTQYGLGDGQSFTNGELAKLTIMAYLEDPSVDFYPLDVGVFLDTYNMDTPENVIAFMNALYTTFSYTHVNRIYFSVLNDALSCKRKYSGLMKTSMVALHGVKPFLVGGIFDD